MFREATLALVLVTAALAGCFGDEAIDTAAQESNTTADSQLARDLGAIPAPANVTIQRPLATPSNATPSAAAAPLPEPWWIATVEAGPDGGLAGFWWTIPTNALVPDGWNEVFGTDDQTLALELAPMLPDGKTVSAWGLAGFTEESDGLTPGPGLLEVTGTLTITAFDGTTLEEAIEPRLTPRFVTTGRDLAEGDRIGFVLIAQAEETFEFGVAFRVLDHDPSYPDSEEKPIDTSAAFLAARGTAPPLALATTNGRGFAANAISLTTFGVGPDAVTYASRTGDVAFTTKTTGPAGGAEQFEGSTIPAFSHGWAISESTYFGYGTGGARWTATADDRGETHEGSGVAVETFGLFHLPVVPPVPYAYQAGHGGVAVISEGDGDLTTALTLARASGPGLFSGIDVGQFEFGATLEELLGAPSIAGVMMRPELPIGYATPEGRVLSPTPGASILIAGFGATPAKAS